MKKYVKPVVEVVSLKSSEDIAATFKGIQHDLIKKYLSNGGTDNIPVSLYAYSSNNFEMPTTQG